MALLDVRNLSVQYRVRGGRARALHDVSFALEPGQMLAVVGESGCGKTTMALALMGLLPSNAVVAGSVALEGRELAKLTPGEWRRVRGNQVSMVFQGAMNAWNPVYPVGDQIVETIVAHEPQVRLSEARARVAALYEAVGLDPVRMDGFPHEYSGGMKQRAVIAMALACSPKLVIADEPTTALDVIVQDRILRELRRIQKERQLSMLYISHDMAVVAELADVVGVMYAGTIVEMGPATQVFARPVHPYTAALLAASPSLRGPRRRIHGLPGAPPSLVTPLPGCSFSPRCGRVDQVCRDSAPSIADQRDQLTAACWHPLPVRTGNGHEAPDDISSAAVHGVAVLGVHRESGRSNRGSGPIVEVSHADKTFNAARGFFRRSAANVHAVDDASFEVCPGEALGIVGESGSGKTTLGRLLVRLNDATSGSIRVQLGDGLEAMSAVKRQTLRRHVQMIFQDPYESLNPRMTIGDIIAEPLDVLDLPPRATRADRVARMLERVGLSPAAHFLNRYPHELSGGQRQRVAIARAMVVEPRFVVADEPTSMLDVSVRAGIMELLLDLKRDLGVSYLYITHDLSVARYVCDRIAVMYRGKIVEVGESEELLQSPLHPYTRALIASVPVPDPTYRRPDPKLKRATSTDGAEDHCRFLARCPIASSRCADEPHPALATNSTTGHLVSCYEAERAAAVLST